MSYPSRPKSEIAPGFPDGDTGVEYAGGRELGVGVPHSGVGKEFFKPVEDSIPHGEPPEIRGQRQAIPRGGARQQGLKDISDFGTVEDAGERRVDLGRILTPWPVATGGAIFRQVCYV
jgi:hypothetical protein